MSVDYYGGNTVFNSLDKHSTCLHCERLVWLGKEIELVHGGRHDSQCPGVERQMRAAGGVPGRKCSFIEGVNVEDTYPYFYGFKNYKFSDVMLNFHKVPYTFAGPFGRAVALTEEGHGLTFPDPLRANGIVRFEDLLTVNFNDDIERHIPKMVSLSVYSWKGRTRSP